MPLTGCGCIHPDRILKSDRFRGLAMRRSATGFLALALLLLAAPLAAADVEVSLVDRKGNPVADAVVTLLPHAGLETGRGAAQTHTIDQRALRFEPWVEVFRPGDSVVFHNSDRTRHHVYSFSPVKAFEFLVGSGETTQPLLLEKDGVIAIGCNIHDQMLGYLVVTDAPWVARSAADGILRFSSLPPGDYDVTVWQPRLRGTDALRQTARLVDRDTTRLRFALTLAPDPRLPFDRESIRY
jgi:plastocyanin